MPWLPGLWLVVCLGSYWWVWAVCGSAAGAAALYALVHKLGQVLGQPQRAGNAGMTPLPTHEQEDGEDMDKYFDRSRSGSDGDSPAASAVELHMRPMDTASGY